MRRRDALERLGEDLGDDPQPADQLNYKRAIPDEVLQKLSTTTLRFPVELSGVRFGVCTAVYG